MNRKGNFLKKQTVFLSE